VESSTKTGRKVGLL
jgi:hypothetical protein